jgi:8-oxo-dGTP pyrophosphatase MutT (NUDIX family)
MVSFPMGDCVFNYRVAGVALQNGHVLICRDRADSFSLLPGGRVEFGETSFSALQREINEELQCSASPGELLFTAENFFEREGWEFHELAVYYRLILPQNFPFATSEPCLTTDDGECTLDFFWVPAESDALQEQNLYPAWIAPRLAAMPEAHQHVIADDRRDA